ncbi:MAG: hypothetical protein KDA24_17930 [Deltaproteobacteria bacterium]|nr:hypothetical protein [Deltaproteobacteria bacterium]
MPFLFLALAIVSCWVLCHHAVAGRWRFFVGETQIQVTNYFLRETIDVDHRRIEDSRVAGDRVTWAEHLVVVEGREVLIRISGELSVGCQAWIGDQLVFDSRQYARQSSGRRSSPVTTRSTVSGPRAGVEADPRRTPVDTLAASVRSSDDPERVARVVALQAEIGGLLGRIERIHQAAEDHSALGGAQDVESMVADLEAQISGPLAELRALHLDELGGTSRQPARGARESSVGVERALEDVMPPRFARESA